MGSHVVLYEIDENQHRDPSYTCENMRICRLFVDAGKRPMYIVRFNPDDYISENQEKRQSPWGYDSYGKSVLKKIYIQEWDMRLNVLKDTIETCCSRPPSKEIETIHLFFNASV